MIERKITEIKERDPLTEQIRACAYKVHNELGPGFGENIYYNALKVALKYQGLRYKTQVKSSQCSLSRFIDKLW
jgi:GxxExxY protein